MSNLPSARQYVQTEATRFRSAVSESLIQDIGSTVNYLIDERDALVASDSNLQSQIIAQGNQVNIFRTYGTGNPFQFIGPVDVLSVTRTFAASDWVGFRGSMGSINNFRDQILLPDPIVDTGALFTSAINFQLALYIDSTPIFSSLVSNHTIVDSNLAWVQPGAGTHTVRLFKNHSPGTGMGLTSGSYVEFRIEKHG